MLKFLLLGVILVAIYFIFFKKKRIKSEDSQQNRWQNRKDDQISNDLIPCESCDTLVPQSEAIISNGRYYCSEKCMRD
jgi:uncharacterized protein